MPDPLLHTYIHTQAAALSDPLLHTYTRTAALSDPLVHTHTSSCTVCECAAIQFNLQQTEKAFDVHKWISTQK